MSRLNIALSIIATILITALVFFWDKLGAPGSDWKASEFADINAVQSSDLIKNGWIPEWLPASAVAIKETHNIDSNASFLFFHFGQQDLESLRNACARILQPLPELPKDLSADWKPGKPDEFYSCQGAMMAVDSKQLSALLWR